MLTPNKISRGTEMDSRQRQICLPDCPVFSLGCIFFESVFLIISVFIRHVALQNIQYFPLSPHSCDIIFSITWRLALTTKYPLVVERLKILYSSFSGPIYRSGTRLDSDSGGARLIRNLDPLVNFSAHLSEHEYRVITQSLKYH